MNILYKDIMKLNASLKNIKVDFLNRPGLIIDTAPFNTNAYSDIKVNGHYLTDLNLIHCASIHYQSRFKTDLSRRFRHTLDTIEPSMLSDSKNFLFNDYEESELQKSSSEVIGVGFAISLFQRLLDVNFNCFNRIPAIGRSKRCDFEVNKNGSIFILESKGRKSGLNSAVNEIIRQKAASELYVPKYGVISLIPRNGNPVSISVVDPPSDKSYKNENQTILGLLIYYTKVLQLSGFYNLARVINKQIDMIVEDEEMIYKFSNKRVDYENTLKAGYTYEFQYSNRSNFKTFISSNINVGLRKKITLEGKEYLLLFGIDSDLLEIIEKQDFQKLLNYTCDSNVNDSNNSDMISVHDDGTFLYLISREKLEY